MRKDEHGLTPRQARFADEFLIDLNATQAAIRAGYSPRSARQHGFRLLTNAAIQQLIQKSIEGRSKRVGIDADRVLKELGDLLDCDLREAWDDTGRLRKPSEMPLTVLRMLRSFDRSTGRVAFESRLRLLELIGKHIGVSAFKEQLIHRVDVDLAEAIAEGRKRVARSRALGQARQNH